MIVSASATEHCDVTVPSGRRESVMKSEFLAAITQLSSEKGVPKEMVLEALKAALVSAYKRNFDSPANDLEAEVRPDEPTDRAIRILRRALVVDDDLIDEHPDGISIHDQILLEEAAEVSPEAVVEGDFTVGTF